MVPSDMAVLWDRPLLAIAQSYASNNDAFLYDFVNAWTKVMNADRFDGPTGEGEDSRCPGEVGCLVLFCVAPLYFVHVCVYVMCGCAKCVRVRVCACVSSFCLLITVCMCGVGAT